MKVGETVFAIGNPHQLGWTHTQGVISQFRDRRTIDAPTHPGDPDPGGHQPRQQRRRPLRPGRLLLGINTWTADKSITEGIGFAIALDTLLDLAPPPLAPRPEKPTAAPAEKTPSTNANTKRSDSMSTVRLRRLQADYEKVRDYVNRHPRLQLIQADGSPPERYQLEYRIRSLRQTADDLSMVKSHMVEIALPLTYPRMPPQCRMLTPIFHPNIAPHAICIGDHWSPGEPLWSIVARIGEMIAYQSYNTKSPLNGEAARWVDQHLDELPLDPVSMMPDDATVPNAGVQRIAAGPPAGVTDSPPLRPAKLPRVACPRQRPRRREPASAGATGPEAERRVRLPAMRRDRCDGGPSWPASKLRCPRCQTVFRCPTCQP